jgi:hypothetical protein
VLELIPPSLELKLPTVSRFAIKSRPDTKSWKTEELVYLQHPNLPYTTFFFCPFNNHASNACKRYLYIRPRHSTFLGTASDER